MSELNPSQQLAVKSNSHVIIINAGPGTGKTKTLISRIAYLIHEKKVDPSSILAITFTKKAAAEMKERIQTLLPKSSMPYIGTSHSFAHEQISQEKEIKIATQKQIDKIIDEMLKSANFAGISKKNADRTISLYKSRSIDYSDNKNTSVLVNDALVLDYNSRLKSEGLMDYDDILLDFFQLLKNPVTKKKLQSRFAHILVDEFQDTNDLQYKIITSLLRPSSSLFVIGDPLQSIYSFRGAVGDMFGKLIKDYPHVQQITLPINYRSGKHIVHVSSLLFPSDQKLVAHRAIEGEVYHIKTFNEYSEADFILRTISGLSGGTDLLQAADMSHEDRSISFCDVAVIYRNHKVSTTVQEKLFSSGIPYQVIGEKNPYKQIEMRFIIDCLKFIYDKTDQSASILRDYPFVTVKSDYLRVLGQYDISTKPSILIQKIAQNFGLLHEYKPKDIEYLNLLQFQNTISQFDTSKNALKKSLDYISYLNDHEFYDSSSNKVTLLTMHASKGLEYKYVFICGFVDAIIPNVKFDSNIEEEKRLLYVGITRAKDTVYLISTQQRSNKPTSSSRFKKLIECKELVEKTDVGAEALKKRIEKAKIKKSQMKMF